MDDRGVYSWLTSTSKDFLVFHHDFPADDQNPVETTEIELLELLDVYGSSSEFCSYKALM